MDNKLSKTCRRCKTTFSPIEGNFYSNGFTPNGTKKWKPTCKRCEVHERVEHFNSIVKEVFPILECERCGYSKCVEALEFHHTESQTKDFSISEARTSRRNREVLLSELLKCELICANCHREVHYIDKEQ